jgi:dTDP-glucose 4,6-dehydratase
LKHALVAGGGGFIGSHLCDLLISEGYKITIVDNFVTGDRANLTHIKNNCRIIDADIRAPWREWISETDAQTIDEIYNLASPASPIDFAKIPEFILTTASDGHRNLLQLTQWINGAGSKSVPILLTSTSEVYGDPLVHPQAETYWGNVNPVGERSCYDEAKRFAEALTVTYRRQHGVRGKIARIFNTYGPRMRPSDGRVVCNFLSQGLIGEPLTIYGDGLQTRSFCYVDDMVQGLFRLMQSEHLGPMNIGNPREITIAQVAETVSKILQIPHRTQLVPLPSDDPKRRRPDIQLAQTTLGWEPRVPFEEGLAHMLRFFRNTLDKNS